MATKVSAHGAEIGTLYFTATALEGFTRSVVAESDACTLYLLIKPDTDLDATFKAWDTDEQEFIRVNGWLFTTTDEP